MTYAADTMSVGPDGLRRIVIWALMRPLCIEYHTHSTPPAIRPWFAHNGPGGPWWDHYAVITYKHLISILSKNQQYGGDSVLIWHHGTNSSLLIHIPAIRPSSWITINADELLRLTQETRGVSWRSVERYGEILLYDQPGEFCLCRERYWDPIASAKSSESTASFTNYCKSWR